MKNYIILTVLCFSVFILSGSSKNINSELVKIWETQPDFRTPESVMYDFANNILYVANINGNPSVKDGNGFISRLGLNGNIIELKWIKGLNAPKGMGIFENRLYVTDIDRIVEIGINKGKILKSYEAQGSKFLNDIAIDRNGIVYVSDTGANCIYRLARGKVGIWSTAKELESPNGMLLINDKIYAGIKGGILGISIKDKSISTEISGAYTGGTDGLKPAGNNTFIISDWAGKVRLVGKDIKPIVLSDTTGQKINAADLELIPDKKMVLIPTFFDNRVMAYELK